MKRFLGFDRLQAGGCSYLAEAIIHNYKAMKKLFTLFVLVVMSTAVHAQKYHYDVNGDGMVNVSDVTFFVNNILGVPNTGLDEQKYVYDVNGDGMANVSDVTCLVNKILGILNPGEIPPSYLTCPDDHHPHLIDLGLPSGTKWACCNVDTEAPGKQCPSYHGGYYAWGETEGKEGYSWSTYAYDDCMDLGNDIARTQYDVAHVKWRGSWMMPLSAQIEELLNKCTYEWASMDGVDGTLFTGPSGGTIFLPAAGYYKFDELLDAGNFGYYWSSEQSPSYSCANSLWLMSGYACCFNGDRFCGYCLRPVCSANLLLSTTSLQLFPEGVETVDITSGSGNYTVESSNPGVATATLEGSQVTVTATGPGDAVVTVTDMWTGQKATIEVVVFDYLKLSTSSLRLLFGNMRTVDITSGSGCYIVESSAPRVATATLEGTKVTVSAINVGTAVVTVTDMLTGQKETIEVVVFGNISLSTDSRRLTPGDVGTVEITSGSGSYSVACSDEKVTTAAVDSTKITVKARDLGHTVITVTDLLSGIKAMFEVNVTLCPDDHHPHMIDLGLPSGTKWACCNVDTKNPGNQSPTNYGGHYAWGETEVRSSYFEKNYSYDNIGSDIAGTRYDVAHVKWGGTWVMPSSEQQDELRNNCTYRWTTVNGVNGCMFTSKKNGRIIFLPAAGYRYGNLCDDNKGEYYSSTQSPSDSHDAYVLYFNKANLVEGYYGYRYRGRSVRPISRN